MEMEQESPKRIRSDVPPGDILHILGVQKLVVSYLNASDLLSWDQVCKAFLHIADLQWGSLASEKFGILKSDGKMGWKLGNRLLQKPIMLGMEDNEDFGFGQAFTGTGHLVTNQNIIAGVADDLLNSPDFMFPTVNGNRIAIRDAESMNYCRTMTSPIANWHAAICGRAGCEIIVTSNSSHICAMRCHDQQRIRADSVLETNIQGLCPPSPSGIRMLGCERFLLYVCCAHVVLFEVEASPDSLLTLKMVRPVCGQDAEDGGKHKEKEIIPSEALAWSLCQQEFVFFEPNSSSIEVWKVDHVLGSIFPLITIPTAFPISSIVLSASYVVGSSESKVMRVWARESKDLVHKDICDLPEESRLDEIDDLYYPLSMVVVNGDLLVTSSNEGNALCVWNLKTGVLLKRHTDAFHRDCVEGSDPLPDGVDVTSMVYLKPLNTFVCMTCSMRAWSFPNDLTMEKKVESIRRRERTIKRALIGLSKKGEMRGDSPASSDETIFDFRL